MPWIELSYSTGEGQHLQVEIVGKPVQRVVESIFRLEDGHYVAIGRICVLVVDERHAIPESFQVLYVRGSQKMGIITTRTDDFRIKKLEPCPQLSA